MGDEGKVCQGCGHLWDVHFYVGEWATQCEGSEDCDCGFFEYAEGE